MNPDQSFSNASAGQGYGEEIHILGLELTFPLFNIPGFPAQNHAAMFLLASFIQYALEQENLLCGIGVQGAGGLNESAFTAVVKSLPKAYRVLEAILNRCPLLNPITTFGYYCPHELIWRAVWPRLDAPFGNRLKPEQMLACNSEFQKAFNAEMQRLIGSLTPPSPPPHDESGN